MAEYERYMQHSDDTMTQRIESKRSKEYSFSHGGVICSVWSPYHRANHPSKEGPSCLMCCSPKTCIPRLSVLLVSPPSPSRAIEID